MKLKVLFQLSIVIISLLLGTYTFSQPVPSDAELLSTVKNKLAMESSLTGTTIVVTANNGIVTLTGDLNSNEQADTATQMAESIPGVKDVDTSKLTVNGTTQPASDNLITAKVKGKFLQQKLFGDKDIAAITITVETRDGVVTLGGTVDNQDQAKNAATMAKSVTGVKDVQSNIQVSNSQ